MDVEEFLREAMGVPSRRWGILERLIECWATPVQYSGLQAQLLALGLDQFAVQIGQGQLSTFLHAQSTLRQFTRCNMGLYATLYQSSDSMVGPLRRHLLIGFAARGGRLTLPIAALLQSIGDPDVDLLLLRDPFGNHFRQGCPGLGDDFATLVRRVAAVGKEYGRLTALGTSMGGGPAVRFCLMAGANRGVSIGGRRWNDIARLGDRASVLPPSIAFVRVSTRFIETCCSFIPLRTTRMQQNHGLWRQLPAASCWQ